MRYEKTFPVSLVLAALVAACGQPAADTPDVWVDPGVEQALESGDEITTIINVADQARWPDHVQFDADFRHVAQRVVTLDSPAELDALVESGAVTAVYEDILVETTGRADGFNYIGQPEAIGRGFTGAGRSVAVLDTGADWTHEAFGDCTEPGSPGCRILHAQDFAPEDNSRDVIPNHGTNVAGIVAAAAPDVGILALDVFNGQFSSSSDIIEAIDWVIANRDTYGVAAINMSLGTKSTFSEACDQGVFAAPVERAKQAGIVTVVSSGNGGVSDGVGSPGCVTDAVTVGAIHGSPRSQLVTNVCEQYDAETGDIACFSNSSSVVDMLAPGVSVNAAGWNMSGTSQAAPHVAAGIAIMAGMMPATEGPNAWISQLKATGIPTVDTRNNLQFVTIDLDAATLPPEPGIEEPPVEEPPASEEPPAEEEEPPAEEEEPPAEEEEPPAEEEEPPAEEEEPPCEDPVPDEPEPPTAEGISVIIDGGAPTTDSRAVTLELEDEEATRVCISNTSSCTDWRDFQSTVEWELEPGAGSKTVMVWFVRAGGSILSAERASDTIYLTQ